MTSERTPTVIGPILGTRPPWNAPRADVGEHGYVVEEFQLEGVADAYQIRPGTSPGIDGRWDVDVFADAEYRTRILVVRPRDPAQFNGTVVVNWQNVSAGVEGGAPTDEIYHGAAWVGVSAQEVGLYGFPMGMNRGGSSGPARPLVEHDPERYGSLFHPGDQGSFDMFTQAGRAVSPGRTQAIDPLGGLDVQRVVATGGSQSAMRLAAYLNAVHQVADVFDGFVLSVWEGRAPRPEEGPVAIGVRTSLRSDQSTPVIVVNSEFEATHLSGVAIADTEHLRIWEVTGTAHAPGRARDDRPDQQGRVANHLSWLPVHEAALRAMHRWLADGIPAPAQPRIEFDDASPPAIVRDAHGNARGGIRLPEVAVPTAEYRGMAFGTGRAPLFGSARPFDDDELRALYPDRATYVERWSAAVDALVASGALRPEDAPEMKSRGEDVTLPVA
ncbi:MAG TPA: alpha/beta hydrolase domain-containing protein [Acidimicrobiia bacterium]|nr:alpha/beta hydrolase domain-containing protein [Acidimicrobiia bacterium]